MNYIFRIVCKLSVMLILWRPLMPLIETESFELSSRYMLFQTNRKQDRTTSIATRQEFQDGKINQGQRKTIQYILFARWNCTHIADAVQRLQKICENCNGSSKWHNKLIKTPEIGILLKCRIYVPSGSTLNQFDVILWRANLRNYRRKNKRENGLITSSRRFKRVTSKCTRTTFKGK